MEEEKISEEYTGKIAFKYRGSWYHRKKELDKYGNTKYGRLGGFATPQEAEASYYKHTEIFREQKKNFIKLEENKDMNIEDYLIYWFEKDYSKRVEKSTAMITSYAIYMLILPNLPYNRKITSVTTDFINELLREIDKLGKTTANRSRSVLSIAFGEAAKNNLISTNPVDGADLYRRGYVDITILKENQIKKLLELTYDSDWYLEILLALFCGLRKGEILGLKFQDFVICDCVIKIRRQLAYEVDTEEGKFKLKNNQYVEKYPKTENSVRNLRVPKIIMEEYLKRLDKISRDKNKMKDNYINKDYISCRENGLNHALTSLNAYLKNICNQAGLPEITVHGLRHMYATILIEQGVSLEKISALLGHSSIHTTFDIYCSVMNEYEKIGNYMNNTFNKEELEV